MYVRTFCYNRVQRLSSERHMSTILKYRGQVGNKFELPFLSPRIY